MPARPSFTALLGPLERYGKKNGARRGGIIFACSSTGSYGNRKEDAWGGTDYNERGNFNYSDFEPDGSILFNLAFTVSESVVMRLPKNFDLCQIESIGRQYELEQNLFDGHFLHYCVYFKSPKPN